MPQRSILGWQVDDVGLVMTAATVRQAVARARQWKIDAGGRFEVRNDSVIAVWSDEHHPDGGRKHLIGSIHIRWTDSDPQSATLAWITWDPVHSRRAEVLRALWVLLGTDPGTGKMDQ